MSLHSYTLIMILSQPIIALALLYREAANNNVPSLWFDSAETIINDGFS